MSKIMKLLSTIYDIMKEGELAGGGPVMSGNFDMERFCNIILWFEELCNHKKLYYVPKPCADNGSIKISVKDENGNGVLSQVKFFPVTRNSPVYPDNGADGEVNFIREMTDWDGRLDTILSAGDYRAEISKGSEYEIITDFFSVYPNRVTELSQTLPPIVSLKEEGWHSGDLHHHSIYSSPVYGGTDPVVESPAQVCRSMAAMGASFGALSDHHNVLNHKEWSALKSDFFTPILSKEISTSNGHVMSLGVEEDIIYRIPDMENRTDTYLRKEFIRITEEIKKLGGIPQINHPKDTSKAISWNSDFDDMIQIFETMEIWNGSNPMMKGTSNYKAFLLWKKLLEEGRFIPGTAGSDTHNILADDYHEYYNKLNSLALMIRDGSLSLPDSISNEAASFLNFHQEIMPVLKKWIEQSLTSAGVRTYVHVEGEVTQDKLLNSLRRGRSFLTNGPILIPEVEGGLPGDTVIPKSDTVNIRLKLLANRPLRQLSVHTNGNRVRNMPLHNYRPEGAGVNKGAYDYSRILSGFDIGGVDWMFFTAEDDCTNLAITNPIFFKKC